MMLNGWPPLRGNYRRRLKPTTRTHIFLTHAQREKMFTKAFVTQMSTKTSMPTIPLPPSPTTPLSLCPQLQTDVYPWAMLEGEQQQLGQSGDSIPRQSRRSVLSEKSRLSKQAPLVAAPSQQAFDHRDKASPSVTAFTSRAGWRERLQWFCHECFLWFVLGCAFLSFLFDFSAQLCNLAIAPKILGCPSRISPEGLGLALKETGKHAHFPPPCSCLSGGSAFSTGASPAPGELVLLAHTSCKTHIPCFSLLKLLLCAGTSGKKRMW